jgi:PAS domain S-box-containing protein
MSASEPAHTSARNLRRRKLPAILLWCAGTLTLAGLLATITPVVTRLASPLNLTLFYSGLLAVLLGAGAMFLIGRHWLRRLDAARARERALLANARDGIIIFDRNGEAVATNPAVASLLGWPADAITGHNIEPLMDERVSATDREAIVGLLKGNVPTSGLSLQWGDKTLSLSLIPLRNGHNEAAGSIAVLHDLTHETEFDCMKDAFVSVASHELRTPLNAILGYTEMLQEGAYGPMLSEQRNAVRRIVTNTGQLLSLANNLLDHAQLQAGVLTLSAIPFSPAELVDGVQGVMDMMARAKGLKLTGHVADNLPATLYGDRQRLHQILVNLVGNAIKFTDEGMIHTRVYRPDATHWALAVSDTGRGIPAETQSYIFESFRQGDDPLKRDYSGIGLGLSIVRRLVTLMRGEITLESEVGRGSTLTVVLPLVTEEPALTKEGAL